MIRLLQVYRVELATIERAIGSGDERLVRELRERYRPEVTRRSSDLREDAPPQQPSLHDAIGELVDGRMRAPDHPEPYGVAFELMCRLLGTRLESGPFGDTQEETIVAFDQRLVALGVHLAVGRLSGGGVPFPQLATLAALGTIGHLHADELRDVVLPNAIDDDAMKTLAHWIERAREAPGTALIGFSGFH